MSLISMAMKTWEFAFPQEVAEAKTLGIYQKILAQVEDQGSRELADMVSNHGIPLDVAREKVVYDLIQNEDTNLLMTWLRE